MKPAVRVFSRENPCTKRDLWVCFRREEGYLPVPVAQAHAIVGLHAPRYMERQSYLVREHELQVEYYRLTARGVQWLERGIQSYLKNHPAEADSVPFLGLPAPARRRRQRQ